MLPFLVSIKESIDEAWLYVKPLATPGSRCTFSSVSAHAFAAGNGLLSAISTRVGKPGMKGLADLSHQSVTVINATNSHLSVMTSLMLKAILSHKEEKVMCEQI